MTPIRWEFTLPAASDGAGRPEGAQRGGTLAALAPGASRGRANRGWSMGTRDKKRFRLPRVPHATAPGPDERVLKRTGADLQNGWFARHGDLVLTDERLVFLPTLLDTAMRAKRRSIPLEAISVIEREPRAVGQPNMGGRRSRMHLHTEECIYELIVGELDGWIDSLERVYQMRAAKGQPHKPEIWRENHVNVFLLEDAEGD